MRELKFKAWDSDKTKGYKVHGYWMRQVKYHPYANKRGYVPEHRLIFENEIGRYLVPRTELVHHINGNREDNRIENLKLTSPIEHPKGHVGERNKHGQFVSNEPIFNEIRIRLLNTSTGEYRPYTLSELINKTYRKGQFRFRGRYTGLKDSRGVEIYEGDILKHDGLLFMVTWRDGRFEAIRKRKSHDDIRYIWNIGQPGIDVIGNIYENPELKPTEMGS